MSPKSPFQIYQARLKDGILKPDPVQERAVRALDRVYAEVLDFKPKKGWFGKGPEAPRGLYMHGGVGRGKSMLMDLFYECLPRRGDGAVPARRVHFHEFMISLHDYIHARRSDDSIREGHDESLPMFAARVAERSRVLCFDEFHVVDIADAMLLGRLYRCLFEHGVVVVSTSNWEPDRLYEGGLQRDRFLPFIDLIKARMEVLFLDSPIDYRAQVIVEEGSYFTPLGAAASAQADAVFAKLSDGAEPKRVVLEVKGREIVAERAARGVAWFGFAQLCERPLGAEDYLAIAGAFHTVFVEGVPKMGYDRRNEVKRLMNLVDVLYENGTRLVMVADAAPEKLYHGDHHAYEFERTISRLQEMQSAGYIG